MLRWLKKYFIPHKGNHHHPHILRTEALVFFMVIVIFAEAVFLMMALVVLPQTNFLSLILPSALVKSANKERLTVAAPTLATNPLLERAATLKAQDMVSKGYFAHTSPQGITPWYWLEKAGYRYSSAGENLAVNFLDSHDVQSAWMASPGHRANILNGTYTEIGIGTATGMYKGYETTFVVEYFGKPKSIPRAVIVPVKVSEASPIPSSTPAVVVAALPVTPQAPLAMLAAEPRTATSTVLYAIAGILLLGLGVTIVVRMEFPHPQVVLKPLLLVLLIASILVLNHSIGLAHAAIF